MKRYILIFALCVLSLANVKAQEETKKVYLPEQGDFAISFDATPVLKYVGNIFNGNTNNTLENLSGTPITANGIENFKIDNITPDVSIIGKYMITDNIALRANIGVQLRSMTKNVYVADDLENIFNPLNEKKLIDTRYDKMNGFSAILGADYHKGNSRIQGIFGGGIIFGFNNVKSEYSYANAMTVLNQNPSSAWDLTNGHRTLSEVTNNNFFIGFAGNVGVEYFVMPKVSLGAQVNLTAYYVSKGQTYRESEGYNYASNSIEVRNDLVSPGDKFFTFGTNNLGGSLYLSFYF